MCYNLFKRIRLKRWPQTKGPQLAISINFMFYVNDNTNLQNVFTINEL